MSVFLYGRETLFPLSEELKVFMSKVTMKIIGPVKERKKQEHRQIYITTDFIIYTLRQILLQ
jgi:hypothetical protein